MTQTQPLLRVDIRRALTIPGWMSESELMWLAASSFFRSNIVEIGSYLGRSTRAMADSTSGRIFAVDNWRGRLIDDPDAPQRPIGYTSQHFIDNLSGRIGPFVVPVMMESEDAAKLLVKHKFDMIFIDASHDYDNVCKDINTWRPLAENVCLFCGHDYSTDWPDVIKAVDELVPDRQIVEGTSIWYKIIRDGK